jgi:hypothetical protein
MMVGLAFGIIMLVIEMVLFIARDSIRSSQEKATKKLKDKSMKKAVQAIRKSKPAVGDDKKVFCSIYFYTTLLFQKR